MILSIHDPAVVCAAAFAAWFEETFGNELTQAQFDGARLAMNQLGGLTECEGFMMLEQSGDFLGKRGEFGSAGRFESNLGQVHE